MAEISEFTARKQFAKFAKTYKLLRDIELTWLDFDQEKNQNWDFRGIDQKNKEFFPIQYTKAIVNQFQKANIEKAKKGEYEFEYAHQISPFEEVVDSAYMKKLNNADKNIILLVGFHDIFYSTNDPFDRIDYISHHMYKKHKICKYKELWIINRVDNSCNFIF